jgi:hypothetical protein
MKKITIIIIGLLVLLAFASTAIATTPTETNKATGGGTFLLRDFKDTIGFTAIQIDDQYDAKGQITIQYRNNEGPEGPGHNLVKVDVTTLVVEGNKAWIAGVITKSFDPSFIGDGLLLEVIDDTPDKLAFGGGDVTPEEARNLALEKFEFASPAPISGSIKVS